MYYVILVTVTLPLRVAIDSGSGSRTSACSNNDFVEPRALRSSEECVGVSPSLVGMQP